MGDQSRVCLVSQRRIQSEIWRCGGFEFEDVIQETDAADLVMPHSIPRTPPSLLSKALVRAQAYHGNLGDLFTAH